MKVPTMFVIGKRDIEADAVSVRVHGKGNLGAKPRGEAIAYSRFLFVDLGFRFPNLLHGRVRRG
ncbi:MAG: hypothetical protein DME85_14485 [Verrucomicrobia bacterium]|nr:MAG: hypothetical protein DME85_14485 [Verrucomicrobiota bacterium]